MPFEIVRNDIVNMDVDAIVNTADPRPVVGSGVDAGIHRKAGPRLLEARRKIGDIAVGDAAVTSGYGLSARYVIHAVGPVWQGGTAREEELLRRCYRRSLELAQELGCRSLAFPLMAAGSLGFPPELALQNALDAISGFLMHSEMQVYLVVFSRDAFRLSQKLFRGVSSYIDENYIREKTFQQYSLDSIHDGRTGLLEARRMPMQPRRSDAPVPAAAMACPMAAKPGGGERELARMLEETDAGFSETLLKLIDRTGKKDSEIYTRANVSRQHFSKIRNNPDYRPTKATAIAFAIALELDLDQTRDLIGRAGYALTRSSKFDVIVMYFIQAGNYNMFDINAALFEFDQSLLGA